MDWMLKSAAWVASVIPMRAKQALYRIPGLADIIRRGLNLAAPQGINQVKIAAGGAAGMHMNLDLQVEKDYWLGTYEPQLQDALNRFVKPGMVVYDVGANIGYITLILTRLVGSSGFVYSFESLPGNLVRLHENITLNDLSSNVEVVPVAVVDTSRAIQFQVGPSGGTGKVEGSSGRTELEYGDALQVDGLSLDEFVYDRGNPPAQVIKMDIEGGEVLALAGAKRLLSEKRPIMLLELHGPEAAGVAWNTLVNSGYRIYRMEGGFPEVTTEEVLDWKSYIVARSAENEQHMHGISE